MLGVQNGSEWRSFCTTVLRQEELALEPRFSENHRRIENRPELHHIINDCFSQLTGAEILDRLEQANIANAEMRTIQSFINHPQLAYRQRWHEIDSPSGPLPALLPPAVISGIDPVMNPVPALGQHTDSILAEMGYTSQQIVRLRQKNIL